MKDVCFVDTSFYVAISSPSDRDHKRVRELAGRIERVATSEFVLLETAHFLVSRGQRRTFLELNAQVQEDKKNRIVRASHALFVDGVALLGRRPDKDWSLTDCTSFIVMERMGLTRALTADRHFMQAGFDAMLLM